MRYDECKQVQKARLDVPKVFNNVDMVVKLREVYEDLLFTKAQVRRVMAKLAKKHKSQWGLDDKQTDDWVETMTRRLRNLLHVINHNKRSGP